MDVRFEHRLEFRSPPSGPWLVYSGKLTDEFEARATARMLSKWKRVDVRLLRRPVDWETVGTWDAGSHNGSN